MTTNDNQDVIPSKTVYTIGREIKFFHDKNRLREFTASKSPLQTTQKESCRLRRINTFKRLRGKTPGQLTERNLRKCHKTGK